MEPVRSRDSSFCVRLFNAERAAHRRNLCSGLLLSLCVVLIAQQAVAMPDSPPLVLHWASGVPEDLGYRDLTSSIAWGDVDGDGDIDLAAGGLDDTPLRLYRNESGHLDPFAVWLSAETNSAKDVAWGDVDGDGDLDLAVGNYRRSSRLYRNDGGILASSAVWSSTAADSTTSIAWGDMDGDGDLDLAVGISEQPNKVYRNEAGTLTSDAVWSSVEEDPTTSIAWSDVDGDGDLDLAAGNDCPDPPGDCRSVRLYRNDARVLTAEAVWSSTEADSTNSIAWGDYDRDGDADLAVGNSGKYSRLYRNDAGNLMLSSDWQAGEYSDTASLAWGDVDTDGDLDLAVSNSSGGKDLYGNEGGILTLVWSSLEDSRNNSIAWGDVDGDGDPDLAAGHQQGPIQLYRNDSGALTSLPTWYSAEKDVAYSVAWGDVDRDGDPDLAIGGWVRNKLYSNDGGVFRMTWYSTDPDSANSIAWADYDGDGDLDLATGNACYNPNSDCRSLRLYRNDSGTLTTSAVWSSREKESVTSIAWGDVDGDHDLDLAVGLSGQPNRLYRNDGNDLILAWYSLDEDDTTSVAWADYDQDGGLDLIAGNYKQPLRLYRNEGGTLNRSAAWSSVEEDATSSVAWGDVDRDGDPDLAVGTWGFERNRLYRNQGGKLVLAWSSLEADPTTSVAWGDYDGDSDLDLAVGNGRGYGSYDSSQRNRLYRNEGGILIRAAVWSSKEKYSTSDIAWADFDGDGDVDLAVGNSYAGHPTQVYRNENAQFSQRTYLPLLLQTSE